MQPMDLRISKRALLPKLKSDKNFADWSDSASTKSYEELHSREDEVLGVTEVWNILDRGLFTSFFSD